MLTSFNLQETNAFSTFDAHPAFKGDPSAEFYRLSDDPWFDRLPDFPCFFKENPDYLFVRT
jgi:hypothetical protein